MQFKYVRLIVLSILLSSCSENSKIKKSVAEYLGKTMNKEELQNMNLQYDWFTHKQYIDYLIERHLNNWKQIQELENAKLGLRIDRILAGHSVEEEVSDNSYMTYYKNEIDSLMAIKPSTEKFLKVNVFVIKNTGDTTYKNTIWLDEKYEVKK